MQTQINNVATFVPAVVQTEAQASNNAVESLNRVNLRSFIEQQDGLFVSVDFVKLDGMPRTLTGRLGVKAPLKGGVNKVEALDRPYLTMFDVEIRQYRAVSLDTVKAIRACNRTYAVVG